MLWVANLLLVDAVVSPSATAMAYMGVSGRVSWMMGRCGLLPNVFERLNRKAVPWFALCSSLVIGVAMLFGGPSWQKLVSFLSATLVLALAMAPVWCRVAFVFASWATIWCGRAAVEGSSAAIIVPALLYLAVQWGRGQVMEIRHGLWWLAYVVGLLILAEVVTPRAGTPLPIWAQLSLVGAFALVIFPFAVKSRLQRPSPEAQLQLRGGES